MKLLATFLLVLFCVSSYSNNTINETRNLYIKAAKSKDNVKFFYNYISDLEVNEPGILGYKVATHFLKAKYGKNPYKRLKSFNTGKKLLEIIIDRYPNNIELRYIRLGIQLKCPKILGYRDAILIDLNLLTESYTLIKDNDLKLKIKNLIIH